MPATIEIVKHKEAKPITRAELLGRLWGNNRRPKRMDSEIYKERILTTGKHTIRDTVNSESKKYLGKRAKLLRDNLSYLPVFKSKTLEKCWWVNTLSTWMYLTRLIKNNWKTFSNKRGMTIEEKLWIERLGNIYGYEMPKRKDV